jgi:hypothetical protein
MSNLRPECRSAKDLAGCLFFCAKRQRRSQAEPAGTWNGIILLGHVGVTSHFGDLLRRARIPSRIEEPDWHSRTSDFPYVSPLDGWTGYSVDTPAASSSKSNFPEETPS